jgi:quercetin dioxygenase-like cupin family protein
VFSENTESDELKWHRDREDRLVTVLEGQGWEIQMDNELPKSLTKGQKYIIPEGVYHRIIKGQGNLKVSIEFI